MKYIHTLAAALLLLSCSITTAQAEHTAADTLNRELTVITDRQTTVPVERGLGIKISPTPVALPSATHAYSFYNQLPSINARPIAGQGLSTLGSSGFITDKRGYVNLGLGMLFNARADVGYQILSTSKDRLAVRAHHRSTFDDFTPEDINYATNAKASLTGIGVNYSHSFKALVLDINGAYTHNYHNYYGILKHTSSTPPDNMGKRFNSKDDANLHGVDLSVGLRSPKENEASFRYDIALNYQYLKRATQVANNRRILAEYIPSLRLNLSGGNPERFGYGLQSRLAYVSTKGNELYPFLSARGVERRYSDNFFFHAAPYINFEGGNGSANYMFKIGPGISINTGNSDKLSFFPLIDASLSFAKSYRFYLKSTGGARQHDIRQIYSENPYVDPRYIVDPARDLLDARLGFAASFAPAFSFDIYGAARYTKHEHFFDLAILDGAPQPIHTDPYYKGLGFVPYYSDALVWSLGGDIRYDYQGIIGFKLGARYDNWRVYNTDLAAGKPSFTANATIEVHPITALSLRFNYQLRHGMKYHSFPNETANLRSAHLINLSANYKLNNTFSFYAEANNLGLQRYSDFYGYPAQDFMLMLGCNINF